MRIKDKRISTLVKAFLKSGVMMNGSSALTLGAAYVSIHALRMVGLTLQLGERFTVVRTANRRSRWTQGSVRPERAGSLSADVPWRTSGPSPEPLDPFPAVLVRACERQHL